MITDTFHLLSFSTNSEEFQLVNNFRDPAEASRMNSWLSFNQSLLSAGEKFRTSEVQELISVVVEIKCVTLVFFHFVKRSCLNYYIIRTEN